MRQNDRTLAGLRATALELQELVDYLEGCEQLHETDWEFSQNKINEIRRHLKVWQNVMRDERPVTLRMLPWSWN